jgi:hypothetical protein
MRIHIKTNRNQQTVPFDHQHLLTGTIHKWFGPNKIHDGISLYSFSRLQNAKKVKQGFVFEQGTSFFKIKSIKFFSKLEYERNESWVLNFTNNRGAGYLVNPTATL